MPLHAQVERVIRESPTPNTTDREIRSVLIRELQESYRNDPGALLVEEVGLRHGAVRLDLMVVNGLLEGYEVKSDRDSLRRLDRQAETYSRILDRMTLVVGRRHLAKATASVPDWWGIKVAETTDGGGLRLDDLRGALDNPCPDGLAIAKLLWREEALFLLREIGMDEGYRKKRRAAVYARLADGMELGQLQWKVREQLKARQGWRAAAPQR